MPEHDLTLQLVSGKHTSAEGMHFFRGLDAACANRWLSYFDPTVDMSEVEISSLPVIKRLVAEKRRELFGDKPKRYAIACASESSEKHFFGFWQSYFASEVRSGEMRVFRRLDEAFDWLELSEADRAAATRAIDSPPTAPPKLRTDERPIAP